MTTALIVTVAVAVTLGAPLGVWRLRVWRRIEALRRPVLNGIPLPVTDDPRWKHVSAGVARLGKFEVYRRINSYDYTYLEYPVYFDSDRVGYWKPYVERVLGRLEALAIEERARRALTDICDAPSSKEGGR